MRQDDAVRFTLQCLEDVRTRGLSSKSRRVQSKIEIGEVPARQVQMPLALEGLPAGGHDTSHCNTTGLTWSTGTA